MNPKETSTSSTASVQSKEAFQTSLLPSNKEGNIFSNGIKVYFTYDGNEFPRIIKASDFKEFYTRVFSALLSKKSGSKPCNLQYQFGVKWYDLNENTEFEDLCITKDNPELFIKARSSLMDSSLLGLTIDMATYMHI